MKRIDHRAVKARLEEAFKEAVRNKDRDQAVLVAAQLRQYKEVRHAGK